MSDLRRESVPEKRNEIALSGLAKLSNRCSFRGSRAELLQACPGPFIEKAAPFYIDQKNSSPNLFPDDWKRIAENMTPRTAKIFVAGLKPARIAEMTAVAGTLRNMAPDEFVAKMTPYFTGQIAKGLLSTSTGMSRIRTAVELFSRNHMTYNGLALGSSDRLPVTARRAERELIDFMQTNPEIATPLIRIGLADIASRNPRLFVLVPHLNARLTEVSRPPFAGHASTAHLVS